MHGGSGGILAAAAASAAIGLAWSPVRAQQAGAVPLRIVATSPNGAVDTLVTQASIRFSEPMVALEGGVAGRVDYVTVTPAIDLAFHWADTNVLVVTPRAGRFPLASRVTMRIAAGVTAPSGRRLAGPHAFTFETPAPRLRTATIQPRIDPATTREVGSDVRLSFDAPVRVSDVLSHVSVSYLPTPSPIVPLSAAARARMRRLDASGLRARDAWARQVATQLARRQALGIALGPGQEATAHDVVLQLAETLPAGSRIAVTSTGVASPDGPLRRAAPDRAIAARVPPFTVSGPICEGACEPEAVLLTASAPATIEATAAAVVVTDITAVAAERVVQPVEGARWSYGSRPLPTLRELGYLLEPGRRYALRVDASLQDVNGRRLGVPWMSVFDVGLPSSLVGLATGGAAVWESANGPRLPVISRSLRDVRTRVSPVAAFELAQAVREESGPHAQAPQSVTPVTPPIDGREQETLVDVARALSATGTGIVRFSVDGGREASRQAGQAVTVTPRPSVTSALIQVTNIGLTVRGQPDRLAILATRLDTGAPIGDALVRIVDVNGLEVWRGRTGADGLTTAAAGPAATPGRRVIVVEHGGDTAYVADGAWGVGDHGLPELVGVVFSDRGVYRPAERAQVKAFLQTATPRGLEPLPPGTSVTLEVENPEREVTRFEAPVGATGGVEWTVPIPANASVDGYTSLTARRTAHEDDSSTVHGALLVKAVKAVEFTTAVEASVSIVAGRPVLSGTVAARDLSDVPLSGAAVAWTVTRARLGALPASLADDQAFTYWSDDESVEAQFQGEDGQPFRLETRGELDALGTRRARFDLPAGLAGRGRLSVAAQVTDASSQVLGQRAIVTVAPDGYFGVRREGAATDAGGPAVAIVARTPTGGPIAGVPARLRVARADKGDADPDAVIVDAVTGPEAVRVALPEAFRDLQTVVTVRAAEGGRAIMPTAIRLYPGQAAPSPVASIPDAATVMRDRERYAPGDRARLTIAAPERYATALVTLERGGILDAHVVQLEGGRATVDVPVGDSAVGGLEAVVTVIRGRTSPCCASGRDDPGRPMASTARVDLPLDQRSAALRVSIDTDATRRPGEPTAIAVRVRDQGDRPTRADVTIWAVDEGVLALTGYAVPSPLTAMYQRDASWVGAADSRDRLLGRRLPPYRGLLLQTESSASTRDAALELQDDGSVPADARRDFRPLAFWRGDVSTDAEGVARIEAALPDTLTTYRIIAVAAASDARYGEARAPLTVARPLMVRPAVPRFLTRLDRAELRVSVAAGTLRGRGRVAVESLTPDLLRIDGTAQPVELTGNGRALVTFPAEARGAGLARLRIVATLGAERDVVERELPIVDAVVNETSAAVGEAAPHAVETLRLPATLDRSLGQLDVELASTMLVGLAAAGEYVTAYPYACAEQMASRALVLVLASVLGPRFAGGVAEEDASRRAEAQAVLDRLETYHCAGGYGYWAGDCRLRSPYLSAYLLFVRQTAQRHRFAVDPATLARDAADLEAALARLPAARAGVDDIAWRAFAAKVLVDAGRRPSASLDRLYAMRESLPIFALAHLLDATAALDAGSPRVAELQRRLRNALTVGATAHVEEQTLAPYTWAWPSNLKSTALVLDVLSRRGGLSAEEARPIAAWLTGQRGPSGVWSGTQDNVWSLVGLVAYQVAFEPGRPFVAASARLESTELVRQALDLRQPRASRRVPIAEVAGLVPPGGSGRLAVTAGGTAPVFYTTRLSVARPARDLEPLSHGFTLRRRYTKVVSGRDGAEATTFAPGDLVRVTLTVRAPEGRHFVGLSDPLPAGLEVADTSLSTVAPDADEAGESGVRPWWQPGFDRIERRDQRVDLFATSLPAGDHEVSYLVRAVTPGRFFAAPTTAEAMYEPEVAGRGAGVTIVIR